jgi:hypothetical protein
MRALLTCRASKDVSSHSFKVGLLLASPFLEAVIETILLHGHRILRRKKTT